MASTSKELVLVTGGSGFLGAHCIIKCLADCYRVRTTIRSLKRENDVRSMLQDGGATNLDMLTVVEADLLKDDGWKEAVEGCNYVLHVASPYPAGDPKHEDDLIIPARDGTLRVLRAARDAGVKRVVVTSSFAAIGHGRPHSTQPFTEEMWTNLEDPKVNAYQRSKTLAERAAWDFIKHEGGSLELAAINPVGITGPILGLNFPTSALLMRRLLNGEAPGCPQLYVGVVDVRDVADLHLLAMTNPKANGERFLAVAPPFMSVKEMSLAFRERMGDVAKRAPTLVVPNFVLRLAGIFDPTIASFVPELGKVRDASNTKARTLLGWEPRSNVDSIVATGESLVKLNVIKSK